MASERWTPAIAAAKDRRLASMDTTDQVKRLRKTLAKQKKADLIEALAEMAGQDRSVLRELQSRFDEVSSPDQLVQATRHAIVDATRVDECRINYNFPYDYRAYETIQRNLALLTEQGHFDSAMDLSLELMRKGSYQIECSDEGLMTDEIVACINVVIQAIEKSGLPGTQVVDWCNSMVTADGVGFICDRELVSLRKNKQNSSVRTPNLGAPNRAGEISIS